MDDAADTSGWLRVMAKLQEIEAKLDAISSRPNKQWLTLTAAAEQFGLSVPKIRDAIRSGALPARPHISRGGWQSFKVRRADMERTFRPLQAAPAGSAAK